MMNYFGTVIGTIMILGGGFFIYLDYALRPLQVRIEELRKSTADTVKRTAEINERAAKFKQDHGLQ